VIAPALAGCGHILLVLFTPGNNYHHVLMPWTPAKWCSMFTRRPVARLSMMTTSWFCDKVSARFRADEAGPAGDDVAHEEVTLSAGLGLSELCRHEGNPIGAWQEDDIS
jgi:hypothetical protein